jgi:hypothetical protein
LRLGPPALGGILLFTLIDYDFSIAIFVSLSGRLFSFFSCKNGDPV